MKDAPVLVFTATRQDKGTPGFCYKWSAEYRAYSNGRLMYRSHNKKKPHKAYGPWSQWVKRGEIKFGFNAAAQALENIGWTLRWNAPKWKDRQPQQERGAT